MVMMSLWLKWPWVKKNRKKRTKEWKRMIVSVKRK